MRRFKGLTVILISLFLGCTPFKSLNMARDDLIKTGLDEGVVFGSIQIKVEGEPFKGIFSSSLHNSSWVVTASNIRKVEIFGKYSLVVIADGTKIPFIAKLPAGDYLFGDMTSNESRERRVQAFGVKAFFRVSAGKTSYIGRLVLTLPNYTNTRFVGVGCSIEDAENEDATLFGTEYGDIITNAAKELMTVDYGQIRKERRHVW